MSNVYVATRFDMWRDAEHAANLLWEAGHLCTARWIEIARKLDGVCAAVPVGDPKRRDNAAMDLADIDAANAFMLLAPPEGGTGCWIELGYAMAKNKFCIAVGPALERTVFCELIPVCETIEQAIARLRWEAT